MDGSDLAASSAFANLHSFSHSLSHSNITSTTNNSSTTTTTTTPTLTPTAASPAAKKTRVRKARTGAGKTDGGGSADDPKRRCVSTACIACRRRKSKCDGNLPACAACSSVYSTECVYDPNSDHRRKGVYKKDIDKLKTRNSTLEVLIQAILNLPEDDVPPLVQQIRTCESLDTVAEGILAKEAGLDLSDEEIDESHADNEQSDTFEGQLSGNMGQLQLEEGSTRYLGGTSNLIYFSQDNEGYGYGGAVGSAELYLSKEDALLSWTNATQDPELVTHLLNMYFTWHYTYFTTLSKTAFYRDFMLGMPPSGVRKYCTPLLVNAMLALGCHFTSWPGSREDRDDSATAGDHFFKEAKRLIMANDEHEHPRLTTVQALALMSVREAGCGREAKGWVYSGMSFRMACDLGLNLDSGSLSAALESGLTDEEIDARRITFWGCFLFDKCWSNYLGRLPQLPLSIITTPKFDVFPAEESDIWAAYTDSGTNQSHAQPSRTRAVALQISALCEISSDLINNFYNPIDIDKSKGKQAELKKLSDIHSRLETWRRNLPQELEPREGGLPSMLVMHMFFQLLYIHLFRPFLKYNQQNSPLPPNVSPRRLCTQAAGMISKLMRLYKRSHGLRQICNIAVYILHTACTIHLLNLPDKNARRDITHGVKHLEEIAEGWLCARRTLGILNVLKKKWKCEIPEEAEQVLKRTAEKWGLDGGASVRSPSTKQESMSPSLMSPAHAMFPPPGSATPGFKQAIQNIVTSASMPHTSSTSAHHLSHSRDHIAYGSLPPQSVADMQARLLQTPASTHTPQQNTPMSRASIDSNMSPSGQSPSALFGGVDQLLRDSQDWWLRDQSQLAMGFEQWPSLQEPDWAGLAAGASGQYVGAGTGTSGPTTDGGGYVAGGGGSRANGDASNGVNGNGNGGHNVGYGGFGSGIHQYPDEHQWYS